MKIKNNKEYKALLIKHKKDVTKAIELFHKRLKVINWLLNAKSM